MKSAQIDEIRTLVASAASIGGRRDDEARSVNEVVAKVKKKKK